MKKYYVFKVVEGILGEKPIIELVKNLNGNNFEFNESTLKVELDILPLFPYKNDQHLIERLTTLGKNRVRVLSPGIFGKKDKDWFVIASVDPSGFAVFFHDLFTHETQIEFKASKKPSLESLLPTLVQLYSLRNYEKTIESASLIIKIHSEPNFAYFLRGMSFLLVENYQNAIEDLKSSLPVLPTELYGNCLSNIGIAYHKMGQFHLAVAYGKKSIEVDPNDDENWAAYGVSLYDYGDLDQSLAAFQNSIRLNSSNYLANKNLRANFRLG